MPKTKRKNKKLRNKKRTRKIYQKGGGLGSVKKYVKHAKKDKTNRIWNDSEKLYGPLREALTKEQTKIKKSIKKRRNKDIGNYVNQKMRDVKKKFGILRKKLEKHTYLFVDSPPDQNDYQTTNLTFVYDPNDNYEEFSQDEITELLNEWNEWNEIRNILIVLCGVISSKRNNELIDFLLKLHNPSNFSSCNRSASTVETKSQSVVEGNPIETVDGEVLGYKLHKIKHNIACLGYLKQIKLVAEPHSDMRQTPSIDQKLCIIEEEGVCKSIYKYLKEILYIRDERDSEELLYKRYYAKKWNSQMDIENKELYAEYGDLLLQISREIKFHPSNLSDSILTVAAPGDTGTKSDDIELAPFTCEKTTDPQECNERPKCQYDEDTSSCRKKTDILHTKINTLKEEINNMLNNEFKEKDSVNYLKIGDILNYRNKPDAWLPVDKEGILQREILILELLKTSKKIKELLAESQGKSANTNLDEKILPVESKINLLRRQLAMPNVPEDDTTSESKKTIPPPPISERRIHPKNKNHGPPRRQKGKRLFDADGDSPGMLAYPIGSKEAERAAAAGPDPTGVASTGVASTGVDLQFSAVNVNNLLEIIKKLEIGQQ